MASYDAPSRRSSHLYSVRPSRSRKSGFLPVSSSCCRRRSRWSATASRSAADGCTVRIPGQSEPSKRSVSAERSEGGAHRGLASAIDGTGSATMASSSVVHDGGTAARRRLADAHQPSSAQPTPRHGSALGTKRVATASRTSMTAQCGRRRGWRRRSAGHRCSYTFAV
eukprot:2463894-Prymnesium_polylepis.1